MVNVLLTLIAILPFFTSTTTQNIEKAFLQNNSKLLLTLLPQKSHINISLPAPISFADQVSNQQTYFLFKKIFSSYSTFEFYSERQKPVIQSDRIILKARWSFKDKKNNNQYVFNIFFYLKRIEVLVNKQKKNVWKITEIKAEKI
ncbi:hypothetical protein ACFLT2_12190 [Acidobacteriota bacterium]